MDHLGYIVSGGKTLVTIKKVEAFKDWPVPTTQKEVRSFVQFCNFYAKEVNSSF
jgi:hypothetical protein